MPMLNIYPEKRSKAFDSIHHAWLSYPSRNTDHLCRDPLQAQKSLDDFICLMKAKDIFYRELKYFDDQNSDADVGEEMDGDELLDEDVGYRRLWF